MDSEGQIGENPRPLELEYGRDLFAEYLETNGPLLNLGYTVQQIEEARKGLGHLEQGEAIIEAPNKALFGNENSNYCSDIISVPSNFNSQKIWHINAERNLMQILRERLPNSTSPEEEKSFFISAALASLDPKHIDIKTFDANQDILAAFTLLPEGHIINGIDQLTLNLMKGRGYLFGGEFEKPNTWSKLRQRVGKPDKSSTYKAAWLDSNTKRDLVIEYTNPTLGKIARYSKLLEPYGYKGDTDPIKTVVWRKLDTFEKDGKVWNPYGLRPNVSAEQTQEAFAKGTVSVGNFILNSTN